MIYKGHERLLSALVKILFYLDSMMDGNNIMDINSIMDGKALGYKKDIGFRFPDLQIRVPHTIPLKKRT